jgi:hypothetical protein
VAIESEVTTQASGQVRVRYKVTLADSRVFVVGPINYLNISDAQSRESGIEQRIIEQVAEADAEEAVNSGATLTKNRQRRACLRVGMQADQAYVSYALMSRVMPDLLALNRTNAQLATLLDVGIETVQKIKSRWQYLSDNAATIKSYMTVQQGFN